MTSQQDNTELNLDTLDTDEDILLSRIPLLAGSENKAKYLSFRAVGFSVREACQLTGVKQSTVNNWRNNDKTFRNIETNKLRELQQTASSDILRLRFTRTLMMLMEKDSSIVSKSMKPFDYASEQYVEDESILTVDGIEGLTDREWEYFKTIRKNYSSAELLSLLKAIEPDRHQDQLVVLNWHGVEAAPAIQFEDITPEPAEFKELPPAEDSASPAT